MPPPRLVRSNLLEEWQGLLTEAGIGLGAGDLADAQRALDEAYPERRASEYEAHDGGPDARGPGLSDPSAG